MASAWNHAVAYYIKAVVLGIVFTVLFVVLVDNQQGGVAAIFGLVVIVGWPFFMTVLLFNEVNRLVSKRLPSRGRRSSSSSQSRSSPSSRSRSGNSNASQSQSRSTNDVFSNNNNRQQRQSQKHPFESNDSADKYCEACGSGMSDSHRYCPGCGNEQSADATAGEDRSRRSDESESLPLARGDITKGFDQSTKPAANELSHSLTPEQSEAGQAILDTIIEKPEVTPSRLKTGVYSGHQLGFGGANEWFEEFAKPFIQNHPKIVISPEKFGEEYKPIWELADEEITAAGRLIMAVNERETVSDSDLMSAVYPDQDIGFESAEDWLIGFARPILETHDDLEKTGSGQYSYVGATL